MPLKQRTVALMGFRAVGKSSITIQFIEKRFVDSYDPTIEDTFNKTIKFNKEDYQLKIVDTAGQDEHSIFPQSYAMDIHGYIFVYSITSQKSLDVVKVIHDKILDATGQRTVPSVLVGNKSDLHVDRVISAEDGKKLADSWGAPFRETSAKSNDSINEIFFQCLTQIERAHGNLPPETTPSRCSIMS